MDYSIHVQVELKKKIKSETKNIEGPKEKILSKFLDFRVC